MQTYSCGNCGYPLPGAVEQCPRCKALLRGEKQGDEAARQRLDREYRRNLPEVAERRRKMRETAETVSFTGGMILVSVLAVALFVGGGAALGWYVLPRFVTEGAALPLALAGGILGGAALYALAVGRLSDLSGTGGLNLTGEPDWLFAIRLEGRQKTQAHRMRFARLLLLACFAAMLLLGRAGWWLGENQGEIVMVISLLAGAVLIYLAKRLLGKALEVWVMLVLLIGAVYGMYQGLSYLFNAVGWSAQISDPGTGAALGIVVSLPLAYALAKAFAGAPPDTFAIRKNALMSAIFQQPARIAHLDAYDREYVLSTLREMAEAAPEAWEKIASPELQNLVPKPTAAASPASGAQRKKKVAGQAKPSRKP